MPQGQVPRKVLLIWPKRQGVAWTADALMLAAKSVSPLPAAVSSGAAVRVKPSNHRRTNIMFSVFSGFSWCDGHMQCHASTLR